MPDEEEAASAPLIDPGLRASSRAAGRSASDASKNGRARQPKSHAQQDGRHLGDPGVVAVDLVVVELPAVRDHALEPLDLLL